MPLRISKLWVEGFSLFAFWHFGGRGWVRMGAVCAPASTVFFGKVTLYPWFLKNPTHKFSIATFKRKFAPTNSKSWPIPCEEETNDASQRRQSNAGFCLSRDLSNQNLKAILKKRLTLWAPGGSFEPFSIFPSKRTFFSKQKISKIADLWIHQNTAICKSAFCEASYRPLLRTNETTILQGIWTPFKEEW